MKKLRKIIKLLFGKSSLEKWHDVGNGFKTSYTIELSDLRRVMMTEQEIAEFNYHLHKLWDLVK